MECIFNKEKENQKEKKVEDITKNTNKNITIARSLNYSCNPPKTITADDHKNDKRKGEKNKKSTFVIRGSMIKHLNGWELSKKLNANCKVFVKTFSGAKTTGMNDYIKPPGHFISHVGTNDLLAHRTSKLFVLFCRYIQYIFWCIFSFYGYVSQETYGAENHIYHVIIIL